MQGFYSLPSPRVWRGERLHQSAPSFQPAPYSSQGPGYRERTRETVTDMGGGMTRVDNGAPIDRVHGAPQPVPVQAAEVPPAEVEAAPTPPPVTYSAPEVAARNWRADYGLKRD